MRSYPIDTDRVQMISTGTVQAVPAWVVLADGSRRPDPTGRQEVDENGVPQWRVEVIVPTDQADERDRTSIVVVSIGSHQAPEAAPFGTPVQFDGLAMSPGYVNKRTGALTDPRWTASGIRKGGRQHQGDKAA